MRSHFEKLKDGPSTYTRIDQIIDDEFFDDDDDDDDNEGVTTSAI